MVRRTRFHPSLAACALLAACSLAPRSETTPLRGTDCIEPPKEITAAFAGAGVRGLQCPGIQGWQVFVVSSDANAWLELHAAGRSWSFEEPIVRQQPIGPSPAIDDDTALEWRVDARRGPTAAIAAVTAGDNRGAGRGLTRYFVIRLDGTRNACVIGREETLEAARAAADGETACS